MLSSMYNSSIRCSNKLADQRSPFVLRTAARRASGRASRRQRLSAACVERAVRLAPGFAPGGAEETRRALRLRGAGMVTFGEAAGENLHFTASAISETPPIAGFVAHFAQTARQPPRERGMRYPERNHLGSGNPCRPPDRQHREGRIAGGGRSLNRHSESVSACGPCSLAGRTLFEPIEGVGCRVPSRRRWGDVGGS